MHKTTRYTCIHAYKRGKKTIVRRKDIVQNGASLFFFFFFFVPSATACAAAAAAAAGIGALLSDPFLFNSRACAGGGLFFGGGEDGRRRRLYGIFCLLFHGIACPESCEIIFVSPLKPHSRTAVRIEQGKLHHPVLFAPLYLNAIVCVLLFDSSEFL